MPAFLNTLRSVSRRGQWRFRQTLRAKRPDGRVDISDAGLIDFDAASDIVLTVTPRAPVGSRAGWIGEACESFAPLPVLTASLAADTLQVRSPGFVEALFPSRRLLAIPPGIYDVRLAITIGPETAEIFDEPIEFA